MNNRINNHSRVEEAINRLFQRSTFKSNIPDLIETQVIIEGKPFTFTRRVNEINNEGKTVSFFISSLDDGGRCFGNLNDLIVCHCGCKLNVVAHENIARCFICKRIFCPTHSIRWPLKSLSFCRNPRCYIIGRLYQLLYYSFQIFLFSIRNIFGITFPSRNCSPLNLPYEENEYLDINDLRDFILRQRELDGNRNIDRGSQENSNKLKKI